MRPRRVHASLVWSDANGAVVIRWLAHLLHHVFLTIIFGIFRWLTDPHARDCCVHDAARIGPDRDMAGPNFATRKVSRGMAAIDPWSRGSPWGAVISQKARQPSYRASQGSRDCGRRSDIGLRRRPAPATATARKQASRVRSTWRWRERAAWTSSWYSLLPRRAASSGSRHGERPGFAALHSRRTITIQRRDRDVRLWVRSPDGAKRNPGFLDAVGAVPDYATLHPGYGSYDN